MFYGPRRPKLIICNFQFFNLQSNEYNAKMVVKPLSPDRRWKFIYEPVHGDIRLLSKKIPITKYLNLQVWCIFLSWWFLSWHICNTMRQWWYFVMDNFNIGGFQTPCISEGYFCVLYLLHVKYLLINCSFIYANSHCWSVCTCLCIPTSDKV